jgi:hypothetical protein
VGIPTAEKVVGIPRSSAIVFEEGSNFTVETDSIPRDCGKKEIRPRFNGFTAGFLAL